MNCSYMFEDTCYDDTINFGNFMIGSLIIFSIFAIPLCYITKYCILQNNETKIDNDNDNDNEANVVLIPGYIHTNSPNTNEDSPPEYKQNTTPERIV
jgi:hypothetical protein